LPDMTANCQLLTADFPFANYLISPIFAL